MEKVLQNKGRQLVVKGFNQFLKMNLEISYIGYASIDLEENQVRELIVYLQESLDLLAARIKPLSELEDAIQKLQHHQDWRRGKRDDMLHDVKDLTKSINTVLAAAKELLEHQNPMP